MIGKIGPFVARSVEEEFLTERESAFHQNVHTLTLDTTNVMEMIMKRRNVMISAVHVSHIYPPEWLTMVPIYRTTIMGYMGQMELLQQDLWRWYKEQNQALLPIQVS